MAFAFLKGDIQSPTREPLVCTIGLEGTRAYTSEGALVIPPGPHRFVGHCDLAVPAGTFTVVLRTGKVRLQAEVTFEEGKTYTLQEIFNGNNTGRVTTPQHGDYYSRHRSFYYQQVPSHYRCRGRSYFGEEKEVTTEDDPETFFQTYTRDKIDEIVGEIRETTTSNTESLKTLQTQSEENSKKATLLQTQSEENKEGIRGLQNRLSESQTQTSNLVQSTKSDLEKKNSDLARRVEKLESAPPPKAGVSVPEKLDWSNQLYTYESWDYKISVYHIVGPIYYVYIHLANNPLGGSDRKSVSYLQISREIADLNLFFTPQKFSGLSGGITLYISSMQPGNSTFLLDGTGVPENSVGRVGVYAISVVGSPPDVATDYL